MGPQELLVLRRQAGQPLAEVNQPGKVGIGQVTAHKAVPHGACVLQAQELGVQQGQEMVQLAGSVVVHQLRVVKHQAPCTGSL